MNTKKAFITTSIIFFVGILISFFPSIIIYFSALEVSPGRLFLNFLPETVIAIFFLILAFTYQKISLKVVLICWTVLFSLFLINSIFWPIEASSYYLSTHLHHSVFFLTKLPFARLFQYLIILFKTSHLHGYNVFTILGSLTVFVASIHALVTLVLAAYPPAYADSENIQKVTFKGAVKTAFSKYFSFLGCSSRAEFWWFYLFSFATSFCFLLLLRIAFLTFGMYSRVVFLVAAVSFLVNLALIPPMIAVRVRRMHDTGHRGIFMIIPIMGFVLLFFNSNPESEYRSGYDLHPESNILSKICIFILLIWYLLRVFRIAGSILWLYL